ncbi:MAG: type II toxin-antitoxin system antitoxin, RelB/DinJ family [Bacteroidetes bacterium CG_4_10_14_3_um_filter_42_6]|nr:MAG: type II toxin-antitoxin system antitoxin, RelB/DinJ family [Bacteroidetes bacterium CG_4_10_14_3_um_filter_42_6]
MSKTAMFHIRVEPNLKAEVEAILEEIGLSTSEAVTIFFKRVRMEKGIPFEVKIPNTETRKAMKEIEEGRTEKYNSIEEMIESLKEYVKTP